jgi:tetratricopeptide (TPR) repeat protein
MGHQYGKSLAASLLEREDFAGAIAAATEALRAEPADSEHWFDRASAYAASERYAEAVSDFEEARRRDVKLQVLDDDMLDDSYFSALLGAARAQADVNAGCALLDRYGEQFPAGRHAQDASDWQKRLRGELKSHFVKERFE